MLQTVLSSVSVDIEGIILIDLVLYYDFVMKSEKSVNRKSINWGFTVDINIELSLVGGVADLLNKPLIS